MVKVTKNPALGEPAGVTVNRCKVTVPVLLRGEPASNT